MGYLTSLIYYIPALIIDISNIATNMFIIYALRKLNKLSNISFLFIYYLSISDCLVGLTGFAYDILCACCNGRCNRSWVLYVVTLRSFFISHSGRLTTVIAIDRSIRMKYLYKYNNVMTRKKAYLVLMVNTLLGTVDIVGGLRQHVIFAWVYMIFHLTCVVSGCLLYLYTYCNIRQQVTDLNSSLQRNHILPVDEMAMHRNVPYQTSSHRNQGSVEENVRTQGNHEDSKCFTVNNSGTRLNFQKKYLGRDDLVGFRENSVMNKGLIVEMPERSIASSSSINNDLPERDDKMIVYTQGDQDVVKQIKSVHTAAKTTTNSSNIMINRRRNDNDIGSAMLYITMVMVLCYVPIFVMTFLQLHQIKNDVLELISIILLLTNSSCNAIILTFFSREIRSLVNCLF